MATFLNKKESKRILKDLSNYFGCDLLFLAEKYLFVLSSKKRLYIINRDLTKININNIRVNRIGLYFANIEHDIRLSIEGSQIVGPKATKNIVEIDENNREKWMLGEDLNLNELKLINVKNKFVIVKCHDDFLGSGRISKNKLINYIPKERRIKATFISES